jgi:hypothetical protein
MQCAVPTVLHCAVLSCAVVWCVALPQGTSGRKIGELRGHTSSVSHISLDPIHNHIFTLSVDKSIKVRGPPC